MAMTVVAALKWWSRAAADRIALIFQGEELTFREVQEQTSRIAHFLHNQGVAKGDRVGIKATNSNRWALAALGVIKAGAVVVPVNDRFTQAEVAKVLDSCGAVALIGQPDDEIAAALDDLAPAVKYLHIDNLQSPAHEVPGWYSTDTELEDLVALIYTSGSTGTPKGVMQTNQSVMGVVFETVVVEEGFGQGKVTLLALPFVFNAGLISGLLTSMVLGGTLIIEESIDPQRALKLIEEHRVSALFGVPFLWESLTSVPEFKDADLSSITSAWVGGSGVPLSLLNKYLEKGVKLRQIYGSSEIGGVATATMEHECMDHPDSCGIGSVFTEIKVVDADGNALGPGEEGEILLRCPGVTAGYYGDPEGTASVYLDGGWLRTNDLGRLDEDGRLTFIDRVKDLIISGGINISPLEIEQAIADIPGVVEVTVVATPDQKFGEAPVAIVSVNQQLTGADVVKHCEEVLADFKLPRYVILRDEPLPRLANGKLAKLKIRSEYQDASERFEKVR